ncbi:DUF1553 domain-containing protein [Neorhodopirellula lusitana]|nr:DUF1553 domain-containing protein [Neorhodopirellula lusitana]
MLAPLWWIGFAATSTASDLEFNRDIRPIFSDTCFKCHGPDANTREAGLRLDERAAAVEDLGGYAAIVSGDPDHSDVVTRVETDDPDLLMPPPDSGMTLTDDQKHRLRQWIKEGAEYQRHWAFTPIERPDPPLGIDASSPIDAFIDRGLKQAGLSPLGPAGATTQLRRVTLDLSGLPPTIEETERFLMEVKSEGLEAAYERAVERLLQSSRYGERMAWQWLEAARYADTDGYQNDGPREMWRWRDWVIDAYNQNMSFDQFTIRQLAGDRLPDPSEQDLIATAFNRNNRYNSEEGIPIDEFLLENAVDRVDTTATVWMAVTVGCARCHDHKYDPFSQREYYQLIDFFNDVSESGRAIKFGNSEPWIKTPTEGQREKLNGLDRRIASCRNRLREANSHLAEAQQSWEASVDLSSLSPLVSEGLDHFFDFDQPDVRVVSKQGDPLRSSGLIGEAAAVSGKDQFELGKIPGLIGNGRFSIAFWMSPGRADSKQADSEQSDSGQVKSGPVLSSEAANTKREGILVEFVDGHLRWNIIHRWISGVSTVETERTFEPDKWTHITLTNDGTQRASGMQIYVDGILQATTVIRNTNANAAKPDFGAAMSIGYSKHVGFWKGQVDQLRFYGSRTLSVEEAALLAVAEALETISMIQPNERSDQQRRKMLLAYLENTEDTAHRLLLSKLRDAKADRTLHWDAMPTTMVMQDLPDGRPSFVRTRGVYDQLGEEAPASVPAVLPGLDQPADRLGFARWLVDGNHPLTARVAVNRYWQMLFGRGLVGTTEDFGTQGDLPTHPELLDWLAAEFMDSGWDIKAILKTMVISDTYRRSSKVEKAHRKQDPENLFYARANRQRLPGNVLRDQALQVSGLLVEKTGGPSVYPYQPKGLWKEASNFTYKVGKGEDLYRRSLYTYWKRTLSPPNMALLDTADREWCSVKPRQTNTPLQALTLLNDVTFAEAAKKFGELILESGTSDPDRLDYAFERLLCRKPSDAERQVLLDALETYRRGFAASPDQAQAVVSIGESKPSGNHSPVELAAATALANVLLNLEEATTRD